jgi:putative flippase GtrA|tara:strand:- start:806 stop:1198 length:393 start_codon:yes stop_codon:yes gene_type:complete
MSLSILYILFAVIATLINLFSQYIVFLYINHENVIFFAMLIGTISGLVIKYILDKQYIFHYHAKNYLDHGKTFVFYTVMSIFTTIIFWIFEFTFYYMLPYDFAKYIGAMIGLGIGYTIKYRLDKRFVFEK